MSQGNPDRWEEWEGAEEALREQMAFAELDEFRKESSFTIVWKNAENSKASDVAEKKKLKESSSI